MEVATFGYLSQLIQKPPLIDFYNHQQHNYQHVNPTTKQFSMDQRRHATTTACKYILNWVEIFFQSKTTFVSKIACVKENGHEKNTYPSIDPPPPPKILPANIALIYFLLLFGSLSRCWFLQWNYSRQIFELIVILSGHPSDWYRAMELHKKQALALHNLECWNKDTYKLCIALHTHSLPDFQAICNTNVRTGASNIKQGWKAVRRQKTLEIW